MLQRMGHSSPLHLRVPRPDPPAGEGVRMALREVLGRSASQLITILNEWDADGSGTIERREFIKAVNFNSSHGGHSDHWATDKVNAGLIFDELDKDKSGFLDMKELKAFQRDRGPNEVKGKDGKTRTSKGYAGALPTLTLDESS